MSFYRWEASEQSDYRSLCGLGEAESPLDVLLLYLFEGVEGVGVVVMALAA